MSFKCWCCGRADRYMPYYCTLCLNDVCLNCFRFCIRCRYVICEGCMIQCEICKNQFCQECLMYKCNKCKTDLCTNCVYCCSKCDIKLCQYCAYFKDNNEDSKIYCFECLLETEKEILALYNSFECEFDNFNNFISIISLDSSSDISKNSKQGCDEILVKNETSFKPMFPKPCFLSKSNSDSNSKLYVECSKSNSKSSLKSKSSHDSKSKYETESECSFSYDSDSQSKAKSDSSSDSQSKAKSDSHSYSSSDSNSYSSSKAKSDSQSYSSSDSHSKFKSDSHSKKLYSDSGGKYDLTSESLCGSGYNPKVINCSTQNKLSIDSSNKQIQCYFNLTPRCTNCVISCGDSFEKSNPGFYDTSEDSHIYINSENQSDDNSKSYSSIHYECQPENQSESMFINPFDNASERESKRESKRESDHEADSYFKRTIEKIKDSLDKNEVNISHIKNPHIRSSPLEELSGVENGFLTNYYKNKIENHRFNYIDYDIYDDIF